MDLNIAINGTDREKIQKREINMKILRFGKIKVLLLSITLVLLIAGLVSGINDNTANSGSKLTLTPPTFLISAQAASNNEIADRLDNEAGISAYYKTNDQINLDNAANAYRVIELRTADYIIGSVPVTGYEEHYDAHVYVHKDGWILAYYNKQNPIAKLVDIDHHTISTTNLHTVVSVVASAAGVPFTSVTYYDFRYPNATHILMVAEDNLNGLDFTISLPSSYGYYERGFAIDTAFKYFYLDGVQLPLTYSMNYPYYNSYGVITASQLLPDVTHTVEIGNNGIYGVLVVVYREQ